MKYLARLYFVLLILGYKPALRKEKLQTFPNARVLFLVVVCEIGGASGAFFVWIYYFFSKFYF